MKNIKVRTTPPADSVSSFEESADDLRPPPLKCRKVLSRQVSMSEAEREMAWERRRIEILRKEAEFESAEEREAFEGLGSPGKISSLTDGDLSELRGSIDLGFGFKEENGQQLCHTLPALDLYFAVTRQFSDSSNVGSPRSPASTSSSSGSPKSHTLDSWKIFSPGDNPQYVKTRLRQWAQIVACSVRQCS